MEKSYRKCAKKLVPDPFLILVNNPEQSCMWEILGKVRYFQRELSKSLKKVNFFFFQTQSLLMDKVNKTKKGL